MPKAKEPIRKPARTAKASAQKPTKKVTLDDVWEIIAEIGKAHKETEKTLDEVAEAHKKAEKAHERLEKAHEETEKALKETQRIVGDLGNKFGDIAEQMLTPALVEKFEQLTFPFTKINRNVRWKKKELGLSMELDALLVNGTKAMVVEVKSKLNKDYVDDFIEKMEKVRRFADLEGDTGHYHAMQFYGAMAAMTCEETVIKYALDKGLYMIMPSGEDVKITKPASENIW